MDVVIKTIFSFPCRTERFKINGKDADEEDFGTTENIGTNEPHFCGCADCKFIVKPENKEMCISKYKLSEDEYTAVCNILESKLSIGWCNWCD